MFEITNKSMFCLLQISESAKGDTQRPDLQNGVKSYMMTRWRN